MFGGRGTCVEFDFPTPPLLRTDDLLLLDDGRLIEIVAEVEAGGRGARETFPPRPRGDLAARQPPPRGWAGTARRLQFRKTEIAVLFNERGSKAENGDGAVEPDDGDTAAHEHAHHHGHDH